MVKVFRSTIEEAEKRIKKLRREILNDFEREAAGKTGGDSWHNTNKLSGIRSAKVKTVSELNKLLIAARPLPIPQTKTEISLGHKVTMTWKKGQAEGKSIFHICNKEDTQILGNLALSNDERFLSIQTPFSEKLLKKKVGDKINQSKTLYQVEKIEISDYL